MTMDQESKTIRQHWNTLQDCQTVREILLALPAGFCGTLAYGLLAFAAFIPALVMLCQWLSPGRAYPLMWALYTRVGFFGFAVGMLALARAVAQRRAAGQGMAAVFKANLSAALLAFVLLWTLLASAVTGDASFHPTKAFCHDGFWTYLSYAGFFCCGLTVLGDKSRQRVLMMLLTMAAFLAAVCYIPPLQKTLTAAGSKPFESIFYNINHFGYYLTLTCPCAAALAVLGPASKRRQPWWPWLWLAVYSLLAVTLIANNTFGAYLAVLGGVVFLVIAAALYDRRRLWLAAVPLALFILFSFVVTTDGGNPVTGNFQKLGEDAAKIAAATDSQGDQAALKAAGSAGSGRLKLWIAGVKATAEHPLVGVGPENLKRYMVAEVGSSIRPHNEFIQLSASFGLPALIAYLGAILALYGQCWRKYRRGRMTVVALIALVVVSAYYIGGLVGNVMFYTSPYLFMLWGMAASK